MTFNQRFRDQVNTHQVAFDPPALLPIDEGKVIGWDGGYLIQQGHDIRIQQSATIGALSTGSVVATRGKVDGQGSRKATLNRPNLFLPLKSITAVLIQYAWIASDGLDLDTRTKIVEPLHEAEVGWARGSRDDFEDRLWLLWQGDNTATGTENIWVKVNAASGNLTIRLRAFWYGVRTSGLFDLNLYAYSSMKPPTEQVLSDLLGVVEGDDYLPDLGKPIQRLRYRVGPIPTQRSSNIDGDEIGLLKVGRSRLTFENAIEVVNRES